MDVDVALGIFSRWMHVFVAAVAIGSAFFMRLILPIGLKKIDEANRETVFLACRRGLKMVIHTSILLLILSGSYNAYRNWPAYHKGIPLTHALFGVHLLLALIVFGIALMALAGAHKPVHRKWMAVNLVLLAVVVATASTLKWAREKAVADAARGVPASIDASTNLNH